MLEEVLLELMADVLLDDDVVSILLFACQSSESCWGSKYTHAVILPRKVEVFQSGRGEVSGVNTNERGPRMIDG
jgi:hypothetical protein